MNVRQAGEPETMGFSSPHDLTDTRVCRPIIPHPAAVTAPDHAQPANPSLVAASASQPTLRYASTCVTSAS